jgi:hypothetical protein
MKKWFFLLCMYASNFIYSQEYMEGRVIFKWKDTRTSFSEIQQILTNYIRCSSYLQLQKVFPLHKPVLAEPNSQKVDLSTIYEVFFDKNCSVESVIRQLYKTGKIVYAEPRYVHFLCYDPNDPDTANQYWINNIQARLGWNLSQGDTNVKIGIVDTGIQWDHPDLVDNVAYNWSDPVNGVDDDGDGFTDNFHGWDLVGPATGGIFTPDNEPNTTVSSLHHGTNVAGFAAATTDNGIGIAGVGFKCRFVPIKAAGEAYGNTIIAGYEGIVYAADHGCQVINCSWGGTYYSFLGQDVVNYATYNRNATVIAAAGNSNNTQKLYPAAYSVVVAVGATNSADLKGAISSYGRHITVMAPGTSKTTAYEDTYTQLSENYTSFASPIAAGVAALIKSKNPSFTAEQVAQQLRITCDNIDALNPSYAGLLGNGRINMFKALNITSPAVRIQNFVLVDGNNNIPQSGDSIRITGVFKNFLSPTVNLAATVVSNDPYITVVTGTRNLGAIPTLGVRSNTLPFIIKIANNVPANYNAFLTIQYVDGTYTDFEYYEFVINPTFANISTNYVQTSIIDNGKFGYVDYPANTLGLGWLYEGKQHLFEGGILIGRKSSGRLSDNIRTGGYGFSADFVNTMPVQLTVPGLVANQEAQTAFQDNGNPNPLNYSVRQNTWAFSTDKFIINQLAIRNNNFTIQDSVYFGVFADIDIGNALNNRTQYDTTTQMIYTYSSDANYPEYVGIVHLTYDHYNTGCYAKDAYSGTFSFSKAHKMLALTSGIDSSQAGMAGSGTDTYQFISAGPMTILPLDSVIVAYAIVSGSSLNELKQNAQQAKLRYDCIVSGSSLTVDLGPDFSSCGFATLDATTSGAASYLWSNNATTPTIQVNATGTYTVIVFDSSGCSKSDDIYVTIFPPLNVSYSLSHDTLYTTDTLHFEDNTPGATSWIWDFGNGFGSINRSGTYQYPAPGIYTLKLMVSNGSCSDTITQTIVVLQPVVKDAPHHEQIQVYPNPTHDFVILKAHNYLGIKNLQVYNLQGQEILSESWDTQQPLKLNFVTLPKGIYLIKVENLTYKIAIE